jgi:ATP/maltotriose-dependent transcriptional regulator MalT
MKSDDISVYQLLALSIGPQFLFAESGMDPVENFCLQALNRYGDGDGPLQMGIYANLGCIYFYQGKLDQARVAATRAQEIIQSLGSFAYLDMPIHHVLLFDLLARADYQTLETNLDALLPTLQDSDTTKAMVPGFLYILGRSLWLQGRLEECQQILKRSSSAFQYYTDQIDERQLILKALIATNEGKFIEGENQLRQAIAIQSQTRHMVLSGDARLSLAHLFLTSNEHQKAVSEIKTAFPDLVERGILGVIFQEGQSAIPLLHLAIKEGICADFARQMLNSMESAPESDARIKISDSQFDFENPSPRELEVIALLAEGLTNREIADQLYISPGTVKRHTINIYNKLRVHNRTQAVTRARTLGLL